MTGDDNPTTALLDTAEEADAGGDQRADTVAGGKCLLGSTTQDLLLGVHRPVLCVPVCPETVA